MNEVERERFLATLRTDHDFRATVRRELLTEELLNLPQTVVTLVDVVAQQRTDFAALVTEVRHFMERTITLIGEGFTAVRERFDQVEAEIAASRGEFTAEIIALRGEIAELRTDTTAGFTAVGARLDQVDADIRVIKDRLAS